MICKPIFVNLIHKTQRLTQFGTVKYTTKLEKKKKKKAKASQSYSHIFRFLSQSETEVHCKITKKKCIKVI